MGVSHSSISPSIALSRYSAKPGILALLGGAGDSKDERGPATQS